MKKFLWLLYSLVLLLVPLCFSIPALADDEYGMYRLYNPHSGEHFYTASKSERNSLQDIGWKYEDIAWIAPAKSNVPVYRLYNPNAGDHHYTINQAERKHLVALGWKDEGIGWYSATANDRIPVYRQYNPNAIAGAHNYTTDSNEKNHLISIGWRNEGIAWYGLNSDVEVDTDLPESIRNQINHDIFMGMGLIDIAQKNYCPDLKGMQPEEMLEVITYGSQKYQVYFDNAKRYYEQASTALEFYSSSTPELGSIYQKLNLAIQYIPVSPARKTEDSCRAYLENQVSLAQAERDLCIAEANAGWIIN